jgi:DNA-binding beta-propeller fold protein YncE
MRKVLSYSRFTIALIPVVLMTLAIGCVHQTLQVGPTGDAVVVPTAQVIRAAGESIEFEGRPVDLVLSPDGSRLFVKNHNALAVIDTASWTTIQELPYPEGFGASMHGIAVTADAPRVYVTTAQAALLEASIGPDGSYAWAPAIPLPGIDGRENSHANGIALMVNDSYLVVCLSLNNALGIVNLGQRELIDSIEVGIAPYDVVVTKENAVAYVSNYGGRRAISADVTAPSGGTPVVVDDRGVASTGTVSVVGFLSGSEMFQIDVGLHPSDLELSADGARLFVANANSDTVTVIKTDESAPDIIHEEVLHTIDVRPDPGLPFGSAPNALTLENGKLFVANGGNNAIGVFSLDGNWRTDGFIPAGWYPGGVVSRGDTLYIANVKGVGSRSQRQGKRGLNSHNHRGSVTKVAVPDEQDLALYTQRVLRDARVPQALRALDRNQTAARPSPVPAHPGDPSVFEHIVYIIKENRTYDQVFGDLPQGDGDPELCVFGREATPNHHALAEQFVLLDNYYCNGVLSADGHSWATEGNVTDHLEKSFGGFTRSYTFGDDPLTYSSSGFIWDNVIAHGLSFRNYGELSYATPQPGYSDFTAIWNDYSSGTGAITFTNKNGIENLRRYSCPDAPGWNMRIPDVLRADAFLKEFKEFERTGDFPNLVIIYLPQDHGSGTQPGYPTPRAHVADNDLAMGRIVDAISNSRFWPKTCIYVNEDDPQDGFDHVDGHRSLCLVVSPYTKRGKVLSHFYNQTSVLHTMALQLGMPPMNQFDSAAPVMRECFTARPDLTPFKVLPSNIALDEMNPELDALNDKERHWAKLSLGENFEQFDRADEDTLNRIIWHSVKGVDAPYPAHFAGAHGAGLQKRGLVLSGEDED